MKFIMNPDRQTQFGSNSIWFKRNLVQTQFGSNAIWFKRACRLAPIGCCGMHITVLFVRPQIFSILSYYFLFVYLFPLPCLALTQCFNSFYTTISFSDYPKFFYLCAIQWLPFLMLSWLASSACVGRGFTELLANCKNQCFVILGFIIYCDHIETPSSEKQ